MAMPPSNVRCQLSVTHTLPGGMGLVDGGSACVFSSRATRDDLLLRQLAGGNPCRGANRRTRVGRPQHSTMRGRAAPACCASQPGQRKTQPPWYPPWYGNGMESTERLLLIDGHHLFHRTYNALPRSIVGRDGAPIQG